MPSLFLSLLLSCHGRLISLVVTPLICHAGGREFKSQWILHIKLLFDQIRVQVDVNFMSVTSGKLFMPNYMYRKDLAMPPILRLYG
jgi:hypothetical protein